MWKLGGLYPYKQGVFQLPNIEYVRIMKPSIALVFRKPVMINFV